MESILKQEELNNKKRFQKELAISILCLLVTAEMFMLPYSILLNFAPTIGTKAIFGVLQALSAFSTVACLTKTAATSYVIKDSKAPEIKPVKVIEPIVIPEQKHVTIQELLNRSKGQNKEQDRFFER